MATKNSATVANQTVANPTVDQPAESVNTLEYLQAQKKALDEQIKQLKAANKTSKLEREIERQAGDPGVWFVRLRNRVTARVKAGQPLEQAVDEVLAFYRALLLAPSTDTNSAG